ncbi:MAG: rhodanese-like domain-containing protein [Mariprofundaceae bacterium]|nr:rhodanese-like domain-containing protein [Mariprofundaceae bacterium]
MFKSITALELFPLWLKHEEGKSPYIIIDVREENEYSAMHIANSLHIPLASIPKQTHRIPKDKTVYLICQGGIRSAKAAYWLVKNAHYTQLVNVEGGMTAWLQAGYPIKSL